MVDQAVENVVDATRRSIANEHSRPFERRKTTLHVIEGCSDRVGVRNKLDGRR
jgi:hypothetical protein